MEEVMDQLRCAQTCRGLCSALEIAAKMEKDSILEYGMLRDACTYPDVKVILNELILRRQRSIQLLEETKAMIKRRIEVLDQIQEGFEL
jgi:rubrerythrin